MNRVKNLPPKENWCADCLSRRGTVEGLCVISLHHVISYRVALGAMKINNIQMQSEISFIFPLRTVRRSAVQYSAIHTGPHWIRQITIAFHLAVNASFFAILTVLSVTKYA